METKIISSFINIRKMIQLKIALCFLILIFSAFLKAQAPVTVKPQGRYDITLDSLYSKVEVSFSYDKTIFNLLVMISDSFGNTIFLDNQYRFSGRYKRVVNLNSYGKGSYFINITSDNERIYKKINIK